MIGIPRRSIHRKLIVIVMTTTFVALALAGVALVLFDYRAYQQSWKIDLATQADILGTASASALAFADPQAATENLALLKVRPGILAAAIYDEHGRLFARYVKPAEGQPPLPASPRSDGTYGDGQLLTVFQRIRNGSETLGTIHLRARDESGARMRDYLAVLGAILAASLLIALILTNRLQATLTRPILSISDTARRVIEDRDYSLRAQRTTDDEVGYLADAFNNMLAELARRAGILEQSNRALEASDERYQLAIRGSSAGLWDWNLQSGELFYSPRFKWLLGFGPEEFPDVYASFDDALHPEDRPLVERALAAHFSAARTPYQLEYRLRNREGVYRWFYVRGEALFDETDRPYRMAGSIIDITERRQAEQRLRESELLLRIAGRSARIGGWSMLMPDNELVWSDEVYDIHGLSPATALNVERMLAFHAPGFREALADALAACARDGVAYDVESQVIGADGRRLWVRAIGEAVRDGDGRVTRLQGAFQDIDQYKRAVEQVLRRERELRTITDIMPDVLCRFDRSRRLVFTNPAAGRNLGRAHQTLIGLTIRELPFSEPLCGYLESALDEVLLRGQPKAIDFSFESDKGTQHMNGWLLPEFSETGTVEFVLGVVHDRTAEKQAEAALREADRLKDEFIATLAHELRNPLAPVRAGLEILRRDEGRGTASRNARAIIERQVNHMVRLVDDLLDISRITRSKIRLDRERIQLVDIVHAALETSRPAIDAAAHHLVVELPSQPVWVDADLTRMAQAVGNLLNNAIKYTPSGGTIRIHAGVADAMATISVTDNGTGIAPEFLERVFDIFTQVGRTLERAQGGLGLGLSIVRRLVEMHGGRVVASSDGPGCGSRFTLSLPIAESPAPADGAGAAVVPAAALRPLDILVVDDNVDAAETLSTLLALSGHRVTTLNEGSAVEATVAAIRPDAVLLDIGLPGRNGYDIASRLRSDRQFDGVLLIALTGWGSDEDKRRASAAGFDVHLTKPVSAATVFDVLQRLRH